MDRDNIGDEHLDLSDIIAFRKELIAQMEYDEEYGVTGFDHDDDVEALERINELEDDYFDGDMEAYAKNESHMIRDDKFEDYAEEFADSIGAIDSSVSWPLNRIDWEAAAEELKQDYQEVEFGDHTYLIRNY